MTQPKISFIVAISENGLIGKDNTLPWHLPADLKFFKTKTTGNTIIMGRKTYESLPNGPLPNRRHIIITSNPKRCNPRIYEVTSIPEALALCEGEAEVFIIGGASIFEQFLPLPELNRMYITRVHAEIDGDIFFPEFDESAWQLTECIDFEADEKNIYDYSFCVYDRIV